MKLTRESFYNFIKESKNMNTKPLQGMKTIQIDIETKEYENFRYNVQEYFNKNFHYDGIFGIDPGFNTSVCHITTSRIMIIQISAKTKIPFIEKMRFLNKYFDHALFMCELSSNSDIIYLEDVAVWGSIGAQGKSNIGKASLKSEVSSAKGDLLKLARVIGMYCNILFSYDANFELLPALRWKGQLTKKATERWVYDAIPAIESQNLTEHMIDSLGICLSKIYNWKVNK